MTPSEKAFEEFCRDPAVAEALVRAASTLPLAIVRCAFFAGASHAVDRCKAAGHGEFVSGTKQ